MVDPIKGALKSICTILAFCPLSNALCSLWITHKGTLQVPRPFRLANRVVGRTPLHAFHKSSKTNRHQALKHLRQYLGYGNRSAISNGGGRWTFRNWGDIGLSPTSRKTTQTNKPPKHHTKKGGPNISSSLKKMSKHTLYGSVPG